MRTLFKRIRNYLADMYWGLIIVSLLIAIASGLAGACLERSELLNGFTGNLLSEITGIFLGIIVTLLVVDAYVNSRQKAQWAKVRSYTLGAVAMHLCDFASDTWIYFSGGLSYIDQITEGRDAPNLNTVTGLEALADELRSVGDIGSKSASEVAIELYENSRWELDQIQSILIPRVIRSQAEQELVDALIEFDEAHRKLRSNITAHRMAGTHSVHPALVSLIEASARLYGVLCQYWGGEANQR